MSWMRKLIFKVGRMAFCVLFQGNGQMCCLWYLKRCEMYRLHCGVKGRPGNNVSIIESNALVLYYKGQGLGEKVVILQAGVKNN